MRLAILISLLVLITGCSSPNAESTEKLSKDEILFNELEQFYNENSMPTKVLRQVDLNIVNINDNTIKKKLITLVDKAAIKISENADRDLIQSIFEIEDIEKIDDTENIKYFSFLSEDTKKKVLEVCGYFKSKRFFLEDKGYSIEFLDEYNGVKSGEMFSSMNELSSQGNFTIENLISLEDSLMSVDDSIIMDSSSEFGFTSGVINRIFKVIDQNGNTVNPELAFNDYETFISDELTAYKKQEEEYIQEMIEEKEESTTIRIGMTPDEVVEKWGKPEDINRTITAFSTSEQWVYPNYVYLYFDDGILTTIQN
ncbi:hypothetical protein [Robertmurraya sp. Marseille-Q9965]